MSIVGGSIPYTTWLAKFADSLVVNLPVIPGSHNSGAMTLGPKPSWQGESLWSYAQTQNLTIIEQLNMGVRFLDIRLHVIKDEIDLEDTVVISHTYDSDLFLDGCLSDVRTFLDTYPSEFVILYLRIDAAHPLTGDIDSKKSFVQEILTGSGLSFSTHTGNDLTTLKVKDVAGKVMILAPNGAVLPTSNTLSFVDSVTHYNVCSIYENTTVAQAQTTMTECFPRVPVSGSISGVITGYALDGQLDSLPPSTSSVEMNDWFFSNFKANPTWVKREKYPVQVVLIDFVAPGYMTTMLSYATGIDPNSLSTNNTDDVDVSTKSHSVPFDYRRSSLIVLGLIASSILII